MSNGNDELVQALYDYASEDAQELSIRKNEQLTLLDGSSTWWKVRNANGNIGMVPSNYLRRKASLVTRIAHKLPGGKRDKSVENSANMATKFNCNPQPINEEYVSKYEYNPSKDDELSLTKGMKLLVLQKEQDGWWLGRSLDRPDLTGWFPSNYVFQSPSSPPAQTQQNVLMVVRTLYPYAARYPEELTFEQYQLLDVIEEPANDPEWYLARSSDGKVGLVPKNYVEVNPGNNPIPRSNYDRVTSVNGKEQQAQVESRTTVSFPTNGSTNRFPPSNANPNSNDFSQKVWFFGSIKRAEAEQLLQRAEIGEFLVRNCESGKREFSISMKAPVKYRHFKVYVLPDGRYGIGHRQFETLDSLLEHYTKAPIYTDKDSKAFLTRPLRR